MSVPPQPPAQPSPKPRRRPGRPPEPLADSSSAIAQLGALLRRLRTARGLTLMGLGELTGYSWQHLGAVERGPASGRHKEAVRHAEAARQLASVTTSHLTRSWLCAIGAKIAPLTGDRAGALELLDQANDHFERAEGKEEWMYEFDQSALAGYRGQCHLRLGRPREAAVSFKTALTSRPPSCDRWAARYILGLAEAKLALGELDAALQSAGAVLAVFAKRGSVSGLRRVRRFQSLLIVAGHRWEAEALDEQVRAHLESPV